MRRAMRIRCRDYISVATRVINPYRCVHAVGTALPFTPNRRGQDWSTSATTGPSSPVAADALLAVSGRYVPSKILPRNHPREPFPPTSAPDRSGSAVRAASRSSRRTDLGTGLVGARERNRTADLLIMRYPTLSAVRHRWIAAIRRRRSERCAPSYLLKRSGRLQRTAERRAGGRRFTCVGGPVCTFISEMSSPVAPDASTSRSRDCRTVCVIGVALVRDTGRSTPSTPSSSAS